MTFNNLASDPQNWIKDGNTQSQYGTVPGYQPTDIAEFDGAYIPPGVSPDITWDYSPSISTMDVVNGYNGLQTVTGSMEMTGVDNGTSFFMDAASVFNQTISGIVKYDGNTTYTSFNWVAGGQGAKVEIAGGTTTIAGSRDYTENVGVQFNIDKGAKVKDDGYCPLNFTASNLVLTINGTMQVIFSGVGTGITQIQQQGQNVSDCYIDVSGGTLEYDGFAGYKDTFAIPVLVENGGNFNVTNVTDNGTGGYLIVKGYVTQTQKYSVYMTGSFSSVNLSKGSTLECDDDYRQDGGTLQNTDTTECVLQDGNTGNGTAIIAGGVVRIAVPTTTNVKLDINAKDVQFNGGLIVNVQGNGGKNDQLINKNGSISLGDASVLTVKDNPQPVQGDSWVIMAANSINGDFSSKNIIPVVAGLTYTSNMGQYTVALPKN
jgi:hypothetical protein